MKYLTVVLALAVVPVCACATAALQHDEMPDGRLSAIAAPPAVPRHEPLINIRYVLLPPAISADHRVVDEVPKATIRLDGGTTNRVNTEITQIERCDLFSNVRC